MSNTLVGNRGGIVFTTATLSNAGSASTNAVYTLPNHIFRSLGPVGLISITIPVAVSTVLGIQMQVNNLLLDLKDHLGDAVTSLDTGEYLISFNKVNNTLKILTL